MPPSGPLELRPLADGDLPQLREVCRDALWHIARRDYSPSQLSAWETGLLARLEADGEPGTTLLALDGQGVVAFGRLQPAAHLDLLFCRARGRGRGYAAAVLAALEGEARRLGAPRLSTAASLTARAFFERHGFRVEAEEQVLRRGLALRRFRMAKPLGD